MQHYWSLEAVRLQDAWLTIGAFDGVHLGHQKIISHLTAEAHAKGAPAVVLTFYPHPAVVLRKRIDPFYLTTPEERAALLGKMGVDVVITHPFNLEVAGTSAFDFVKLLKEKLGFSQLWVGQDFALGRGREGDVPTLQQLGQKFGYMLNTVETVKDGDQQISSSKIRQALFEGDVLEANRLLGRPYRISGEVVLGDQRGRSLGIPTANLSVWSGRAIPKAGVYVCQALVGGERLGAVTNVGVRPTFENQPVSPRVEAHLLSFDREIYGEQIQLEFIARLRDEQRFPNVQALVDQIHQDIEQGKVILAR